MSDDFAEANRLWFEEGASGRALALYERAAEAAPDDPVVHFQLARALWALGQLERAAAELAVAEANADRLSPLGRTLLERARAKLAMPPPDAPVPTDQLDVDVLERLGLPPEHWLDIAFAARRRDMFGLAAHAFARGMTVQMLEDDDEHEMREAAHLARDALAVMSGEAASAPLRAVTSPEPAPEPASPASPAPPAVAPSPRASPVDLRAPALVIAVQPRASRIGNDVVLDVALRNPHSAPIAVNGRLLLNRADAPPGYGELALTVEGPPGYENNVAFTVRSGRPSKEHFVVLEPGAELRQTYSLHAYESLHLPGRYRLWATYRNETRETVDGMAAFVGAVSSDEVELERRAT